MCQMQNPMDQTYMIYNKKHRLSKESDNLHVPNLESLGQTNIYTDSQHYKSILISSCICIVCVHACVCVVCVCVCVCAHVYVCVCVCACVCMCHCV